MNNLSELALLQQNYRDYFEDLYGYPPRGVISDTVKGIKEQIASLELEAESEYDLDHLDTGFSTVDDSY